MPCLCIPSVREGLPPPKKRPSINHSLLAYLKPSMVLLKQYFHLCLMASPYPLRMAIVWASLSSPILLSSLPAAPLLSAGTENGLYKTVHIQKLWKQPYQLRFFFLPCCHGDGRDLGQQALNLSSDHTLENWRNHSNSKRKPHRDKQTPWFYLCGGTTWNWIQAPRVSVWHFNHYASMKHSD